MTARIECPLCDWFHNDLGPNPKATDPMALASVFGPGVFAAHAINQHARKIEEILRDHFNTHTTVEWVRKVTELRAKVEAMQHVVNCASAFAGPDDEAASEDEQEMFQALLEAVTEYRANIGPVA